MPRYDLDRPEFENSDHDAAIDSMFVVGAGRVLSDNDNGTFFLQKPNYQDGLNSMQVPIIGFPYDGPDEVYSVQAHVLCDTNKNEANVTLDVTIRDWTDRGFWYPVYVRALYNYENEDVSQIVTTERRWITYDLAPWGGYFTLDECARWFTGPQRTLCIYADYEDGPWVDEITGLGVDVWLYEAYVTVNGEGAAAGGWGVGG